ncbi:MAG: homoserine dehydrogenase [Clostridia bacterium]|nr:homoserine dehydrogenase [Clostridia bacterium]
MIKIAILGFGTVGSGVYELIKDNKELVTQKAGTEIETKYILDVRDFSDREDAHLFVNDYDVILNDDEVSVVVETIGGLEPACTFTKKALSKGKSVVTSNKELVATCGNELISLAVENNAKYMFEASVGGGIPIIRPLFHCYVSSDIKRVCGILNGTTNYILTEMFKNGQTFEKALLAVQQNGYAERDPSADVDGHDTCKKICILSSIISGQSVDFHNVYTEGITKISLEDTKYAASLDSSIKLIGESKVLPDGKMEVHVAPMMISKDKILASIEDVYNGVVVDGGETGDTLHYGRGAGKLPTASAVVADVVELAKNAAVPYIRPWAEAKENLVVSHDEYVRNYFVRIKTDNADKCAIGKVVAVKTFKEIFDGEIGLVTEKISYKSLTDSLKNMPGEMLGVIEVME